MKDDLGDRIKKYESQNKDKFISYLPVYARIDGRNFSKYTKKFDRPFDERLSDNMAETTAALVKEFRADLGFTQSDEISLFWFNRDKTMDQFPFGGVKQKFNSLLAGYASSFFVLNSFNHNFPENNRIPHFDSRVMQLPNMTELYNTLVWRQKDAFRNAITSQSIDLFSHKEIQGVSTSEKILMILDKYKKYEIRECIEPRYLFGLFSSRNKVDINGNIRTRSSIYSPNMSAVDFFSSEDDEINDYDIALDLYDEYALQNSYEFKLMDF